MSSHKTVGNTLEAQGDLAGALTAYRTALAIAESLTTQEPDNTKWQNELASDHKTIGDLLSAQSDSAGALTAYRAALAIAEGLTTQEPDNTKWQNELASDHKTIGDLLSAQSDSAGALTAYRAALARDEGLARQEPDNIEWQDNLASDHQAIGNLLKIQGNPADARAAWHTAQVILERLVAQEAGAADQQSFPDSRRATNGLKLLAKANMADALANSRILHHAIHFMKLGEAFQAQGDPDSALAAHRAAQLLIEPLVARNPDNTICQSSLMLVHKYIGNVLSSKGKTTDAVEAYRAAVATGERLVAQAPDRKWKAELASSLGTLSWHYLLTGQFAEAKAAAEKGYSIDHQKNRALINLAHAEMFLGHTDAAMELHVKHLNDVISQNVNNRWREVVVNDFAALQKAGLNNSKMIAIKQFLTKKDR